jgi:hypothetical protein
MVVHPGPAVNSLIGRAFLRPSAFAYTYEMEAEEAEDEEHGAEAEEAEEHPSGQGMTIPGNHAHAQAFARAVFSTA